MAKATTEQPLPTPSLGPDVTTLVREDLELRAKKGEATYGQRLRPHIGRNALLDAYQEVLDLSVYFKQRMMEEEAFLDQLTQLIGSAESSGAAELSGLRQAKALYVRLVAGTSD